MKNIFAIACVAIAVTSASCSGDKADSKSSAQEDETAIIEVDVAQTREVEQGKSYTANVEAFNSNNISPNSPNRIKTIRVDVGDKVRRGQVLVTLDASTATQLKVSLDQTQRDYDRAVQLLKIGSGTQATVDQLKAQLDAARAQYNNVLENTTLVAPVSGVVTARNYDPGDMTGTLPVLTIGQITPSVKVVINIAETDRAKVHTGMPVTVTLDAFPERPIDAKINRVYPQVDAQSRTFSAEVVIPNPGAEIFPGMFARVNMNHGSENRVVVSDRAVVKQTGSGNKYVYVYRNGTVSFNRVELGQRLDNAYELISGVNEGDTIVIAGQTRLADGVKARIKSDK